jgi:transposase
MGTERTSVGLDVHARSVSAAAIDERTGELVQRRLDPGNPAVLVWVDSLPKPVAVAYEAGPTGFGLARDLTAAGHRCVVAAPSKLIRPAGDHVKTDARDAVLLARLLRVGELTEVRVPSRAEEDARDLVRAREDARGDLMRVRHRLGKLLLRHGHVFPGDNAWSAAHERWLRQIRFDAPGSTAAFEADHDAVAMTLARRNRLDTQIAQMAADSEFTPVTTRLCCLRGVSTLTGFALAVELGDWTRFTGSSIGAYLGLVPGEHSSGGSRNVLSITKAGNSHARRLLVEAAWHHKPAYRPSSSATLQARWAMAPAAAVARADTGNRRLQHRWDRFEGRSKRRTIAAVAIARELAGWCWSLAVMPD